ncbi:sensor histidine kinase [Ekhidna sp. To15]|uniref:sensor histidine kinase n=1 Tax=Ekhidna sp. To15 TaxID=3395267 RepID=UPI003F51FC2F
MLLRELAGMINGIRRYFGSLPISFFSALLATIVVAFLTGLQSYLLLSFKTDPVEVKKLEQAVYFFPIINYGVWLLLSPLLFRLILIANKLTETVWRNASYVVLGIALTLVHEVGALFIYNGGCYTAYLLNFNSQFIMDIQSGVLGLSKTFIEYWVISFLLMHFHSKKKLRKAKLRNVQLESNLVKAQMSALKNQLHPHFLFNSFNTISALMEEDVPLAQRMIAKLGLLLRKILKDGDVQLVSLEDEVEMAKLYLEVEQIRFKGRLVTRFAIDPKVKLFPIPTLILQPAVENAIKHGFYNKTGSCEISIKAYEEDEYVCIEIIDNGAGKKNDSNVSFGIGLTNMKHRLTTSYGEGYELNVNAKSALDGFIVEIKIRKGTTKNENINSLNR